MGASGPSREGPANRYEKPKKKNLIAKYIESGGIVGSILKNVSKPSKKSKQNVLDYEGQAAGVTPMRNPINQRDREGGGNNIMTPAPKEKKDLRRIPEATKILEASATSPSTQVKGDVADEEEEYDVRRTKRRGRRMTILTPTGGVRGNFVLGKPTLLGS